MKLEKQKDKVAKWERRFLETGKVNKSETSLPEVRPPHTSREFSRSREDVFMAPLTDRPLKRRNFEGMSPRASTELPDLRSNMELEESNASPKRLLSPVQSNRYVVAQQT